MKLLAITPYYKPAYVYGGPVRSTAALYEGLVKLGVDVTVITTNANGNEKLNIPYLKPLTIEGVKVIYCPTKFALGSPFYSATQIMEAKQFIQNSDIVNLQTFWGYATYPLSQHCIKNNIPYFVSLRGQLMDYAMQNANAIKRLKKYIFLHFIGYQYLNKAAALHATSPMEIAHLHSYPIKTPLFLVPNGIDLNTFESLPMRGQIRAQYGISENALVMVLIGRLHPVKNPHIAVAALIMAQTLEADVHLIVAGPDEYGLKPALIRQACQAGYAEKLHFSGLAQNDELLHIMADSDLFIMPSESENFGMSAAESMAAGLPVLVSDRVPIGKWAKEAAAGEIAACNAEDFSKTAVTILSNLAQLKEMGQNGKVAAAHLFHPDTVAKAMLEHLERIICTHKKQNHA